MLEDLDATIAVEFPRFAHSLVLTPSESKADREAVLVWADRLDAHGERPVLAAAIRKKWA